MKRTLYRFRTVRAALQAGLLLVCTGAGAAPDMTVHGVTFPPVYTTGTNALPLHGVGLCRVYFFKVYVGALYLQEDIGPEDVLKDVSKRLELHYLREIPADIFVDHTRKGMEANLSENTMVHIRKDLNRLNGLFRDVAPGDVYALTYIAGKGLRLERNGTTTGAFDDPLFARALFTVWLGRVPMNRGFKEDVLTPIRTR